MQIKMDIEQYNCLGDDLGMPERHCFRNLECFKLKVLIPHII